MSNWHYQSLFKLNYCLLMLIAKVTNLVPSLLVVGEVSAQVVAAPVLLHQIAHLLVLGVPLQVGVSAGHGALQVVQLLRGRRRRRTQ